MPPVAGVVLEQASEGHAGVASAVSNTFRQVGGALAIALFGVFVARDAGFSVGMQLGLATAAALAVICLVCRRCHPARTIPGVTMEPPLRQFG